MEIVKADVMGFCMGVQRAVEMAMKAADQEEKDPVTTLGPLIHNPEVLSKLKSMGIGYEKDPESLQEGTVIIRAHGISPDIKKELEGKGLQIIDATCPRVLASQKIALNAQRDGVALILVGDKNHGEVEAIAGCHKNCIIIEPHQLKPLSNPPQKAIVIGQTTIKQSEYDKTIEFLKTQIPELKVYPTLCVATAQRQEALLQLIEKCDAILVIGGKESANTARLTATAKENGIPAWQIENASEIPQAIFDYEVVGITAGASTPSWTIEEVEAALTNGARNHQPTPT